MKIVKVISLIIGCFFIFCLVVFLIYCYLNLHWFDKYEKAIKKSRVIENQILTLSGNYINYAEVINDNPPLLLIHGQGGMWQDYALVFPELSKNWHIYAIDVYGHGKSSHNKDYYYLDKNANDIIWFINNMIGQKTVVSGHSNGALIAAYIGTFGGDNIKAIIMEDPPVFSTEGEDWENHFSYLDTFKNIHEYQLTDRKECWAAYYFKNCYWGKIFMNGETAKFAKTAEKYHKKHPDDYVKIFYLPYSLWYVFKYYQNYDFDYAETFYYLTWNNGYTHKEILSGIKVPCIYIHAKESFGPNGELFCAASKEQALKAISYIGDNCIFIETPTSDHNIHTKYKKIFIDAINSKKKD